MLLVGRYRVCILNWIYTGTERDGIDLGFFGGVDGGEGVIIEMLFLHLKMSVPTKDFGWLV